MCRRKLACASDDPFKRRVVWWKMLGQMEKEGLVSNRRRRWSRGRWVRGETAVFFGDEKKQTTHLDSISPPLFLSFYLDTSSRHERTIISRDRGRES